MGLKKKKANRLNVSIEWFEKLVAFYYRNRIKSVTPSEVQPYRHSWYSEITWSAERDMWTVKVKPGFCHSSAGDPEVRYEMQARHAPQATRDRLGLGRESDTLVAVPLSEGPAIDLPADLWRALGTEALNTPQAPAEAVRPYFKRLGVADPVTLRVSETGGLEQVIEGELAAREDARLLRAIDLVLSHERSRTGPVYSIDPVTSLVTVSMQIVPPPTPVTGAKIHRRTKYEAKADLNPLSALLQQATDDGVDELHLATLYLLSEPGLAEGTPIDETWQPVPGHFEFWPLQYRASYEQTTIEPTRLNFDGAGLGLGSLNDFADALQKDQNNRFADLEAAFNTAKAEGRFFTL